MPMGSSLKRLAGVQQRPARTPASPHQCSTDIAVLSATHGSRDLTVEENGCVLAVLISSTCLRRWGDAKSRASGTITSVVDTWRSPYRRRGRKDSHKVRRPSGVFCSLAPEVLSAQRARSTGFLSLSASSLLSVPVVWRWFRVFVAGEQGTAASSTSGVTAASCWSAGFC